MAAKDLVDYLREGLNKGHSINSLKKHLIGSGWKMVDVEEAVKLVSGGGELATEGKKTGESVAGNSVSGKNSLTVDSKRLTDNGEKKEVVKVGSQKVGVLDNQVTDQLDRRKVGDSGVVPDVKIADKSVLNGLGVSRPMGVKMIAILYWIMAGGMVFASVAALFIQIPFITSFGETSGLSFIPFAFLGVLLIIALIPFLIGLGLWKGKNGWRVTAIVFATLGILSALFALAQVVDSGLSDSIQALVSLVANLFISGWIAGYLLFSKKVKSCFVK